MAATTTERTGAADSRCVTPGARHGAFATRHIAKGTRLDRVSRRARLAQGGGPALREQGCERQPHIPVHRRCKTVIDAGVDGNDARFFNHSCDPNCESVIENGRVYIEATRAIAAGRGADLRLSDPARGGRSAEHRRDIRLPLRGAQVSRHDAVAHRAQAGQAARAQGKRKKAVARKDAATHGAARRSARQGKAVGGADAPLYVCTRSVAGV